MDPFFPIYSPQHPSPFAYDIELLQNPLLQSHVNDHVHFQGGFSEGQMLLPFNTDPATAAAVSTDPFPFSNVVNGTHVQSMPPPPTGRKRKAPTLRDDDWHPVKARVIELHITQGLPLPKVKEMVEEEFKLSGFTATIRQYRTRISQWNLDKNVKPDEMRAIVRKRQRRRLVEGERGDLVFKVRGSLVEPEKIDRWMKREGVAERMLYSPSLAASTPAALSVWTASDRGSPDASSPHLAGSPVLSAGQFMSPVQSPRTQSPAPSLSSVFTPKSSDFAGMSPAPIYRSISYPGAETTSTSRYRHLDEDRLRHELSLSETRLGAEHLETLHVLLELGIVFAQQGRYKSAEEMLRRSLIGLQRQLGNNNSNTTRALDELSNVLLLQGFYHEATKILQKASTTRSIILGAEHPSTLSSMSKLALTHRRRGRFKEAEELEMTVLDARKRVLGAEHPSTLVSITNLAATYWAQGRLMEAEELEVTVQDTRMRVLGPEHPDTLGSMANLALTYKDQGRLREAEELGVTGLDTEKRVLGAEHPDTLGSMANLALTYRDQGRLKEAEELGLTVLDTRKRVLGTEHPDTVTSMANLAVIYSDQGRLKEAEELEVTVLDTRKRVLGAEHPHTLISMEILAFTWDAQGQQSKALQLLQKCVQLCTRILGVNHIRTVSSSSTLIKWQTQK